MCAEPGPDASACWAEQGDENGLQELILQTLRQPSLVLDGALRVAAANRAFYELFALTPDMTLGHPLIDLPGGPWDTPALRMQFDDLLRDGGAIRDHPIEHVCANTGRRWLLLNARRALQPGGGARIALALDDITEEVAAREALEKERLYVQKIVDSSHDALLVLDFELRVKSANETFYAMFQVTPAETLGQLVYELGDGQWNVPQLRRLLHNVLPDNETFDDFDIVYDFPRIGLRHMQLNARRVDHIQLILLAIDDRTEAVTSRSAQRESESRYRRLFNAIDQGFCIIEVIEPEAGGASDFRFLEVNAAFEQLTMLTDVIGQSARTLVPWLETFWFETYARIVRTRVAERFEQQTALLDAYYDVFAFPIGRADQRQLGVLFSDIRARKRAERHQDMLIAELDHRVKNMLGVVQSIVRQSLRSLGPASRETGDRLIGRLSALAQSHQLLANSRWEGASFASLLDSALAPHRGTDPVKVTVEGADLQINARAAQTLALALHELVTNAVKHGALSGPQGRLDVVWAVTDPAPGAEARGASADARFQFHWRERECPRGVPPTTSGGFGLRMIEQIVAHELNGHSRLDFGADGIDVHFDVPFGEISALAAQSDAGTAPLQGRRVLVAVEQPVVARATIEALRTAGSVLVGPFPTLAQACTAAARQQLDAAVLDMALNGQPIWPAALALRARGVPILFIGDAQGRSGLPRGLVARLGDAGWIAPPIAPQPLVTAVAELIAASPPAHTA